MTDQTRFEPLAPGLGLSTIGAPEYSGSPPRANLRSVIRLFLDNRLAVVGLLLVIAMAGFCFLGPLFYHTQQTHTNLLNATLPPGRGRPLGTDSYGFDLLGRL